MVYVIQHINGSVIGYGRNGEDILSAIQRIMKEGCMLNNYIPVGIEDFLYFKTKIIRGNLC